MILYKEDVMTEEAKDMVKDMFDFEETYQKYSSHAKAVFLKNMLQAFSISLNDDVKGDSYYNTIVINTMVSYLSEETINEFFNLPHSESEMNIKGTSLHSLALLPLSLQDGLRIAVNYDDDDEFNYLKNININNQNTLLTKDALNSTEVIRFINEINKNYEPLSGKLTKEKLLNGNVADIACKLNNLSYVYTLNKSFGIKPLKSNSFTNENIILFYYEILKNDSEKYLYNKEHGFENLYRNLQYVFDHFDKHYDTDTNLVGELLGFDSFSNKQRKYKCNDYIITLNTIVNHYDKIPPIPTSVSSWTTKVSKNWVSVLNKIDNISAAELEKLKVTFEKIEKNGHKLDKQQLKMTLSEIENKIICNFINKGVCGKKTLKRI